MNDRLFTCRLNEYSATRNSDGRQFKYPHLSKPRHKAKTGRKQEKHQDYYGSENKNVAQKATGTLISKVHNGRRKSSLGFKAMVNLFLRRSSIYALNQVGNSATTSRKVVWTFIILVGVVGIVLQVWQFFTAYFKYPVVVNMDLLSEKFQEFPAVTVCNMNVVRNEYLPCLEKGWNSELCLAGTESEKPQPLNKTESLCPEAPLFFNNTEKRISWLRKLMSLNSASKYAYGHKAKDFIRSCKFDQQNCNYADFVSSASFNSGNCYIFNFVRGTNRLYTASTGPHTGLDLELDLEIDKYTEYTDSVGARVQIHSPYMDQEIDDDAVIVSPGFKTFIGLSKYVSERLPAPYKDHCREYAFNDSSRLCHHRCVNNVSLSLCSCHLIDKNTHRGFRKCDWSNAQDVCCVLGFNKVIGVDVCDCPLPCHETNYEMRISHAEWPSRAYYDANKYEFTEKTQGSTSALPLKEVRSTRLKLQVFFDTLDYTVYKQNPMYQSSEVLSQVGGQMGLWLGLSLTAIFECIENIIALVKYRISGK